MSDLTAVINNALAEVKAKEEKLLKKGQALDLREQVLDSRDVELNEGFELFKRRIDEVTKREDAVLQLENAENLISDSQTAQTKAVKAKGEMTRQENDLAAKFTT